MTLLLDSDIVNYLLRKSPRVGEQLRDAIRRGDEFVLSPVVHFEVTRYLRLKGSHRAMRFYRDLTARWNCYEFTPDDGNVAVDLWAQRHRAGRPIEDSDLLIAVSALQAGATLVTNNPRHFEGLGIALESWST
ncbi:MAG: type II toxin-antitoxin system VapC family toxin [Armatimonadetes bacterium]|jgi:tRNA(fMet)-specific endonuclease VapC|nr:type II toxin-antitoxin system VapC family toxin [Armatimonadota bacterium]